MEKASMRQLARLRWQGLAGVALVAAALAAPAAAEPVYEWRTEDGGYAFSDDLKAVPARYRDQVKVRETRGLTDYKRFTPADDGATERYAEQLSRRLAYLRAVNAAPPKPPAGTLAAAPGSATGITMQSSEGFVPSVDLSGNVGAGGPIVVETYFTRPEGKLVTRQTLVVRQGDQTLAIVKPRLREWDVATDIHDESELER
jgi:hypothetical protein